MLETREGAAEGSLIIKPTRQRNLCQRFIRLRKKVFGALDPKLNQPLMDGGAKRFFKAAPEMTR